MKDAKSEAQKEIEDYRSQKESEFKSFETEVSRTVEHISLSVKRVSDPRRKIV